MKNSFGSAISVTLFGESHGPAVGAVLDGIAPGVPVEEEGLAREMQKRRAVGELATPRKEEDAVQILSGVYNGYTTGTPICLVVQNQNVRSGDYAEQPLRPGHADYTGHVKYLGYEDARGGGHFSGRVTAPLVAAGAICRTVLAQQGVLIGTHIEACAGIADAALPTEGAALKEALQALNDKMFAVQDEAAGEKMRRAILAAKEAGDSVGGVLETAVMGLPAGWGEPFFGSVESVLSALLFSVPAVKGVEFGLGFGFAERRGSEVNDPFVLEDGRVKTVTNNNGGVNGGITNGMPLVVRCVVKPTPSIAQPQNTVDLATGEAVTLAITGRHDPCILPRARAVVDAMVAIGLLDLLTQRQGTLGQRIEKE